MLWSVVQMDLSAVEFALFDFTPDGHVRDAAQYTNQNLEVLSPPRHGEARGFFAEATSVNQ